jgi:hypothetical protein
MNKKRPRINHGRTLITIHAQENRSFLASHRCTRADHHGRESCGMRQINAPAQRHLCQLPTHCHGHGLLEKSVFSLENYTGHPEARCIFRSSRSRHVFGGGTGAEIDGSFLHL